MRRGGPSILLIVYVIVGVIVAANRHYFSHVHSFHGVVSAVLAVLLWPLVVLGWIHIKHYR